MSNSKTPFKKTLLTTALTLATVTTAHASIVTDGIDYQYFRDFAENKGKFAVGASNIAIVDKKGNALTPMFADGTPMVDWASVSLNGVAHLIDPQYIVSVRHNGGYGSVQFGSPQNDNHSERNFTYLIVDRNDKPHSGANGEWTTKDDYHLPRLHKLVTEVAPIRALHLENWQELANKERFTHIVRTGAGEQWLRPADGGADTQIGGAYQYLVGGNIVNAMTVQNNGVVYIGSDTAQNAVTKSAYGSMPAMTMPGDSGSPIYAFDKQQNEWVAVSVHHGGNKQNGTWVILHQQDFINKTLADDLLTIDNKVKDARINWLVNGKTAIITSPHDPNLRQTVNLRDESLANPNEERFRNDLNHGQSIRFTGEKATLRLGGDIHQGAGALYFDNDFTVIGARDDATWVGAGISVADGKTVEWRLHNPQNDRLSKIGKGTLHITGRGENKGNISVGEGKVILNQQADNANKKQAFGEVHITSGRGTVVLGDNEQVNPDNIVFGFRGGRLDLNGNDVQFDRLRTVDDGAKIVNHNANKPAHLTLTATPYQESDLKWLNHRERGLGLYEYKNNHKNNRLDYFVLTENGNPTRFFPTEANSDQNWTFLGHNRTEAVQKALDIFNGTHHIFQGNLGEVAPSDSTPNHALNVSLAVPNNKRTLILSGESNLNGTLAVKQGRLLLSGTPTLHAYDHQKNQDVIKDDEWIDRQFTAKKFDITGGELATSRNVSKITGDIHASNTASVKLGFENGTTEHCYRSDYTGKIHCNTTTIANDLVKPLSVVGTVNARDNATLQVLNTSVSGNLNAYNHATITLKNNAQSDGVRLYDSATLVFANDQTPLVSQVQGGRKSQVVLNENAHWQLPKSTVIGHLDGKNGSQITLSDSQKANEFQTLTLNGDLTGTLTFHQRTNLNTGKGDLLTVNGYATGNHTLAVQNTGDEAKVDELTLVALRHGGQESQDVDFKLKNGFVDAGSLRYTLKNNTQNEYYLFNEQKANEIKAKKEAEAEKARQAEEQAKKALEDAIKARETAEKARDDLQKALDELRANSGATATDLANAQKQAEDAQKRADDAQKLAQTAQQQAEQAIAEKRQVEKQLENIRTQLQTAEQQKEVAERQKSEVEQQLNTIQAQQIELQNQLDTANREKLSAEQEKETAQNAQKLAEQQAQTASREKEQAEAKQREAESKQQEAESQRTIAQNALDTANQQKQALEQQLADAIASGNSDTTSLREQLAQATAQISEKERELTIAQNAQNQALAEKAEAERQKNDAQTALNQAQQDLTTANALKDQAINRAEQAETQKQAVEQNLTTVQAQLTQAQNDKETAEQKAREAETAKAQAERVQKELEQAQVSQAEALKTAQETARLAEQAKQQADDEAKRQADLARQAEDEKNRQTEFARLAELAKQQAETAQKLAEDAKNQALTDLANAEQAKTQAELAKTQAENAQKLADTARENAEKALQTALADKQTAETAKTKAESDLATALREKQLAEDTLKLAQQNSNQDIVNLQNQLAQANQAVKDKELALANAETAKQNAETAQKLAEKERDNALQSAQTAELAKTQAENTLANIRQQLDQANADKLKAEQDKQASDLAKQQANQVKDQALTDLATAQLARDRAEQAKNQAEQTLTQLQADKQKADDNLAKVQGDLIALQAEKTQLQTALDTANAEKSKVQNDLATALREKQEVENALALARQNDSNDVVKLQDDLAKANSQVAEKTAELQNAITAQTNLQNEINDKNLALTQAQADKQTAEQTLNDIRTQLATAQAEKQASDLAKQQAEIAQKLAEDEAKRQADLARQAEDEKNRQAELARLAEIEKNRQAELTKQADLDKQQAQADLAHQANLAKQAQSAKQVADTLAQNAQKAQDLAEQAKTQADLARQKAEEANLALRQANERLQNLADTNAQVLAQAQTHLQTAQKLADDRQAILTLTEQNLAQAQADLAKAQSQNEVIAEQLAQAQALHTQAELAKQEAVRATQEANQARLVAIDAQTKSDSEKEKALLALAQAEQLAKDKQALAEQAELARLALSEQLDKSLKQLEATQAQLVVADTKIKEAEAKQALAETEAVHLRTLSAQQDAELARIQDQHKKQAELISQYANTALSEISAQAHHLHRVSDRIDDRLQHLTGKNSGLWATTDSEKTTHSSDLYRAYEQDSQLTQIGVDNTAQFGTGNLTLGGAISHLSHTATFDDNFKGEGTTLTGTMYGKWHTPSGLAITSDISAGQTNTQIEQTTASTAQRLQPSDIKRTVASVGVGISQTFNTGDKAGNLDLTAHAGVRRHHLGDANYAIIASDNTAVKVKQDDIDITSYQAGITASKTIHTANGFGIRPSIGISYRHSDSQATLDINDRPLIQRFDSELKGQVGLVVGKGDWEVNLAGEYGRGEERGERVTGMAGIGFKW